MSKITVRLRSSTVRRRIVYVLDFEFKGRLTCTERVKPPMGQRARGEYRYTYEGSPEQVAVAKSIMEKWFAEASAATYQNGKPFMPSNAELNVEVTP